ncbi:uncharacterized protein GGS22DRAFT_189845 [Annulohypoxylon maeteangense]|uniref:uncharacterized protein n=1 Tax=Annulohypoxylon maeteangense TaxID=1927788 RepID=UPI0020085559|nr:uncharacterized protein GGS22DRAFT_189845 [Annulohypoxylon maeteangense]KAI0883875.1 hypothetical protein GGS22DRAFT_189845 [Annulohypoxylon maeteangense]
MSAFKCGHELPKSRIGVNFSYLPLDNKKRCPECQTKTAPGILGLLKSMQESHDAGEYRDPGINQHLITYVFDRFITQRKGVGFQQLSNEFFCALGEVSYHLLDRKQLSSFLTTVRGRWGSDIAKQTLRALGAAALRSNGIYELVEPANAEILSSLNRMILLSRERASAIETFQQLQIILDNTGTLRMLRDDVTIAVAQLEEGYAKWEATITRK